MLLSAESSGWAVIAGARACVKDNPQPAISSKNTRGAAGLADLPTVLLGDPMRSRTRRSPPWTWMRSPPSFCLTCKRAGTRLRSRSSAAFSFSGSALSLYSATRSCGHIKIVHKGSMRSYHPSPHAMPQAWMGAGPPPARRTFRKMRGNRARSRCSCSGLMASLRTLLDDCSESAVHSVILGQRKCGEACW